MLYSKKWIQSYIAQPLPSDDIIVEALTLYSMEVEGVEEKNGDSLFDLKVLPNRAHDCLSHRGMAREWALLLKLPLIEEKNRVVADVAIKPGLAVHIDNPEHCRRYCGAILKGVKIAPSPDWLVEALASVGQRSVNTVVDATNYVLLSIGQPTHVFDLAKMNGQHIRIRNAHQGETISLLGSAGQSPKILDTKALVVTDGSADTDGTALALAGVKGGIHAEVTNDTTDIVIESASFAPGIVRYTSRGQQLLTDAAKRFENELSSKYAGEGLAQCIALIQSLAGGTVEAVTDAYPTPETAHTVSVSLQKINDVLGVTLSADDIRSVFDRRAFVYEVSDDSLFTVSIPAERLDIRIEEDLVEEVGQLIGYHTMAPAMPATQAKPALSQADRLHRAIKLTLSSIGFSEVYTYAFGSEGEIEVQNPLASDKAFLRSTLKRGISQALDQNIKHIDLLGLKAVAVFEIGTVFTANGERTMLCIAAKDTTKKQKDAAQLLEAARNALTPFVEAVPEVADGILELDITDITSKIEVKDEGASLGAPLDMNVEPISSYPYIVRDIALFAPNATMAAEISKVLIEHAGELLKTVRLFDIFTKEEDGVAQTSYAFRLVFQSNERTLVDEDAATAMDKVYAAVAERGWRVR